MTTRQSPDNPHPGMIRTERGWEPPAYPLTDPAYRVGDAVTVWHDPHQPEAEDVPFHGTVQAVSDGRFLVHPVMLGWEADEWDPDHYWFTHTDLRP